MKKKTKTARRATIRQTSDPVSKIAGKAMRIAGKFGDGFVALVVVVRGKTLYLTAGEIQALAASCLNQDQTKGARGKPSRPIGSGGLGVIERFDRMAAKAKERIKRGARKTEHRFKL